MCMIRVERENNSNIMLKFNADKYHNLVSIVIKEDKILPLEVPHEQTAANFSTKSKMADIVLVWPWQEVHCEVIFPV